MRIQWFLNPKKDNFLASTLLLEKFQSTVTIMWIVGTSLMGTVGRGEFSSSFGVTAQTKTSMTLLSL